MQDKVKRTDNLSGIGELMNRMKNAFKLVLRGFLRFLCIIFFKIPFRVKVEGLENLPKDRAIIVCPNHKSTFDAVFLVAISPRNIAFMSKKEIWNHWWGRIIGFAFDMIPTDRDSNDLGAVKTAYKVLDNKGPLGIFPEGTRYGLKKGSGFKTGIIYLSLKKNADIVPVGISGDIKIFRKNTIRFGKPINFKKLFEDKQIEINLKDKQMLQQATDILVQYVLKEVDQNEYSEFRNDEILKAFPINN